MHEYEEQTLINIKMLYFTKNCSEPIYQNDTDKTDYPPIIV